MKKLFLLMLFLQSLYAFSQNNDECYVQKDFAIILSSKDYNSAYKIAVEASQKLNIKLDLRDLIPCNDPKLGLTFKPEICIEQTKEFEQIDSTCYIARGRFDDGIYVSIEYSSAYLNFREGYYIVIIGSGETKDANLVNTLNLAKKVYKDAYIKTSKVYMCCMH